MRHLSYCTFYRGSSDEACQEYLDELQKHFSENLNDMKDQITCKAADSEGTLYCTVGASAVKHIARPLGLKIPEKVVEESKATSSSSNEYRGTVTV